MMAVTNGGEVRERERERVVDRRREMAGILFCFTWVGVVVKCQLWLSELVTLAGHVTCTWSRTNVSFTSCCIILSAITSTNIFIGNPCP